MAQVFWVNTLFSKCKTDIELRKERDWTKGPGGSGYIFTFGAVHGNISDALTHKGRKKLLVLEQ